MDVQLKAKSAHRMNLLIGALLHSDWWCHVLCSTPFYIDMGLCTPKWPIMAALYNTPPYIYMGLCATKWPIMAVLCSTPSTDGSV